MPPALVPALKPALTKRQAPRSGAPAPAAGTHHDQQPPGPPARAGVPLRPVIDHILRTGHCTLGSILLVEDIQTCILPGSKRWRTLQLLLGDGRLCIQAILGSELHSLVQTGKIAIGTYVRLNYFSLGCEPLDVEGGGEGSSRPGPKPSDSSKHGRGKPGPEYMVYLAIEDIVPVGRSQTYVRLWRSQRRPQAEASRRPPPRSMAPPDPPPPPPPPKRAANAFKVPRTPFGTPTKPKPVRPTDGAEVEKAFDDFDMLTYPLKISPRKPRKLPEPPQAVQSESREATPTATATATPDEATLASPSRRAPVSLPRDWHHLQTPLRLTTLHSIPHLPFAQGWSCNILAVVTSLSPVEPSLLPPHRQRIARLADPSTSKRVHLTVFLDPDAFAPAVGSVVLLVGVKNHPFDGGSLKKYASDAIAGAPATGTGWWFEDPWDLEWCDVAGMKEWWATVDETAE